MKGARATTTVSTATAMRPRTVLLRTTKSRTGDGVSEYCVGVASALRPGPPGSCRLRSRAGCHPGVPHSGVPKLSVFVLLGGLALGPAGLLELRRRQLRIRPDGAMAG